MKKIVLFIFLSSCGIPNLNYNKNNEVLKFSNELNYDEFKSLLIKYAKINSFPSLNK
jgi:hypothetical protein